MDNLLVDYILYIKVPYKRYAQTTEYEWRVRAASADLNLLRILGRKQPLNWRIWSISKEKYLNE